MNKKQSKLQHLEDIISSMGNAIIAYSGGVDSTFLSAVCQKVLGNKALAVTASSETYPSWQLKNAIKTAKLIGIKHSIIKTSELNNPSFAKNTINRCYWCKSELFSQLRKLADKKGIKNVIDGSNYDDFSDYRPGSKAAKKLKVRSPLQEALFRKKDIRTYSKIMGLPTWDMPAYACLTSRFPYDTPLTLEKVKIVDKAELFLKDIGIREFRVRHYDSTARIEVGKKDFNKIFNDNIRSKIVSRFKKLGYHYVTVDLQGYRTGSMNEHTINEKNGKSK